MTHLLRRPFILNLPALALIGSLLAVGGCTNGRSPLGTSPDPRAEGSMILYSLDGDRYPGEPVPPGTTLLHGWSVIKACPIDDRRTREEILHTFEAGVEDYQGGIPVDCFRPRHAIRIEHGGVTTDHLICFQCSNWMTWTDGLEPSGSGYTSDTGRRTFDRILQGCTPAD